MVFKKYLPKSLYGRASMIIILPIAIMQMAVAYFFFNAHWDTVTANLSDSVAADVSLTVELYKQAPSAARTERLDAMLRPHMELSVVLKAGDDLPTASRKSFFSALDKTLRRALDNSLEDPFWFDTTRYPNHIDIRVSVDEGVLRFIAARERVFAPTGFVFIFWLITATVLLTLVSIVFIRNQAKPISQLADAADAFGKGQDISGYKPSGASEARRAGQSFLKMRQRINRHIEQRTILLAGVSHDLRTPLTRLKLHLALQKKDAETQAARQDIIEMESMLEGYLDFARGLSGETSERVDIADYLQAIIAEAEPPQPRFRSLIETKREVELKPMTLKRAITNLISNAQKYGTRVEVNLRGTDRAVSIDIEDDGPGIPAHKRDEAFKPFQRLDTARNQNIEGVGLGLAIARDIAQTHGGTLTLGDSKLGGLKATLRIPA